MLLGGLLALGAPGLVLLVGRHGRGARRRGTPVRADAWQPLAAAVPDLRVPAEVEEVEVETSLITSGTRRLVESALATYRTSLTFYDALVAAAPQLAEQLRQPEEGDVVGLLVSDRHDNIGMDPVAGAVAEAGGATFLLDAGDDTSTGSPWEAFSLESLAVAFEDFENRFVVAGNHDSGDFVTETFDGLGFTTLTG